MNYEKIRQRPRQFESVTAFKIEEFDFLHQAFYQRWKKFYRYHTIEGKKRKHPLTNPSKNTTTLPTSEDKLFFLLVYLKNYTLQEMMAASFGFSQSNASKWGKILRPILLDSLKDLQLLPLTQSHRIAEKLEQLGVKQCILDGTERPILKSVDRDTEEQFYSGKKKAHTVKNNLICTEDQFVVYLSQTHEGTMHDKTIAQEEQCEFPDGIHLFQDKGFDGYAPENVFLVQPFKKPKKQEYTELQKWFNTYVSKIRIVIENAINGIKRCRIVKDKCRHFSQHFRHEIMVACTGLHNLRVYSPFRAYKSLKKWTPVRVNNNFFE